jgi:hypothetical protein
MHPPRGDSSIPDVFEAPTRWRPAIPAWLISALIHAMVLTLLALTLRFSPAQAPGDERIAEVGIVLKRQDGERTYFEHPAEGQQQSNAAPSMTSLADALEQSSPIDPSSELPSVRNVIGMGNPEGGGIERAADALSGQGAGRDTSGGEGRTSVFGVEGKGSKFAYVFDRSASMEGSGRSPLSVAKGEMIASLESLGPMHQFLIIFYNERPWVFNPAGETYKLALATDRNKEQAKRFIGSMTAEGGTRHEEALLAAIRTQPDVIFFLTDADEPRMTAAQLDKIHRRAGGIAINTIEFGFGPESGGVNFLARLAQQNGGQYKYIDVTRFNPRSRPTQ